MKRRTLLGGAGLTVLLAGCGALPVIPKRPLPEGADAQGWIHHADGCYTLWLPRAEMGQHVGTALLQIASAELGVPPEVITLRLPSTAQIAPVRATVGSESIALFALPLAQACATLRQALATGQTAGRLPAQPLPAEQLRAFQRTARTKTADLPHPDGPALVRGQPLFAADVRRLGTVYGRVLRAPASPDLPSRLTAADEDAAQAVPGFVALVRHPLLMHGQAEGLGLLARSPGALDHIEAALAPQWSVTGSFGSAEIAQALDVDRALAAGALPHTVANFDQRADGTVTGPWDVDLNIDIDAAPHAGIEPRCAVAEFGADGALQVWTGTQDAFYVRAVLARRLGLDEARITVHGQRIGGAFGGRTLCTVELEAAVLARSAGAPVKLQWTRADELQQGFHRPPSRHRVRARVAGGRLQAWWHAFVSSPILLTNAALPAWLHPVTRFTGDGGVARGAALPYRVPHQHIEYALQRLPLYAGPWRGLGAGPNGLAVESAIDECARRAGQDALAFRLAMVADPRLARVLQRVADAAGWARPAPPGVARGLACGIYKERSYAAVVAEVSARDGRWRVSRLLCAHDCGQVLHVDSVRAQCEGNLVWGLGMVFGGALPLAGGGVAARGFDEAPVPRLPEVPLLQVLLVDEGEPPSGAGETAIVAAAGAIANALRAASGVRPTRFPLAADDPAASSRA
ncbi:MAG: molybdopterin-dependent oxidoreductase [Rubrivivax sp.]|nr:molybdopterin-dependent oxidoreductase [Rubrivivax sp.]